MAKRVAEALKSLNIPFETWYHAPATTIEVQAQVAGHIPGSLTKNLVLKDKKEGVFLVCVADKQVVDLKLLVKKLNLPNRTKFRFVSEELLYETLQVKWGSVSALAVINDKDNQVKLVLDESLLAASSINSNPLQNDTTFSIAPRHLLEYVRHFNHEPIVINFSDQDDLSAPSSKQEND